MTPPNGLAIQYNIQVLATKPQITKQWYKHVLMLCKFGFGYSNSFNVLIYVIYSPVFRFINTGAYGWNNVVLRHNKKRGTHANFKYTVCCRNMALILLSLYSAPVPQQEKWRHYSQSIIG